MMATTKKTAPKAGAKKAGVKVISKGVSKKTVISSGCCVGGVGRVVK